eukprot:365293-Chlamydomonas_euryale.AAC.4
MRRWRRALWRRPTAGRLSARQSMACASCCRCGGVGFVPEVWGCGGRAAGMEVWDRAAGVGLQMQAVCVGGRGPKRGVWSYAPGLLHVSVWV